MEPKNPDKLSDEQLLSQFEEAAIYREIEQEVGQITPWVLNYKQDLHKEILTRIEQ